MFWLDSGPGEPGSPSFRLASFEVARSRSARKSSSVCSGSCFSATSSAGGWNSGVESGLWTGFSVISLFASSGRDRVLSACVHDQREVRGGRRNRTDLQLPVGSTGPKPGPVHHPGSALQVRFVGVAGRGAYDRPGPLRRRLYGFWKAESCVAPRPGSSGAGQVLNEQRSRKWAPQGSLDLPARGSGATRGMVATDYATDVGSVRHGFRLLRSDIGGCGKGLVIRWLDGRYTALRTTTCALVVQQSETPPAQGLAGAQSLQLQGLPARLNQPIPGKLAPRQDGQTRRLRPSAALRSGCQRRQRVLQTGRPAGSQLVRASTANWHVATEGGPGSKRVRMATHPTEMPAARRSGASDASKLPLPIVPFSDPRPNQRRNPRPQPQARQH